MDVHQYRTHMDMLDEGFEFVEDSDADDLDELEEMMFADGEEDDETEPEGEDISNSTLTQPTLDTVCHTSLPVEVWERIMMHMPKHAVQNMAAVSRQHYAITKEIAFRARYFLSRYMRCQAIFQASVYKKMFTPELLKCLLQMGAVMSRYFIQSFCFAHCGMRYIRTHQGWAEGTSNKIYLEVVNEGARLYGDSLCLVAQKLELTAIRRWAESSTRSLVLEDSIKEIFVKGRYAGFMPEEEIGSYRSLPLCSAIAKHPELVEILENNGYDFTREDQEAVFTSILQKGDATEDEVYKKVDDLLTRFPHWNTSSESCKHLFSPHQARTFNSMPHTEAGRQLLAENDGIGPVAAPYKVMRRLYLEGKAFQDLDEKLVSFLEHDLYHHESCYLNVGEYRMLLNYFPHILFDIRDKIAHAYLMAYQHKADAGKTASELEIMQSVLFDMIKELELKPIELARVFVDIRLSKKILLHAIKEGLFGSDWMENVDKVIITLIRFCIETPRSGEHLEEIEEVVEELCDGYAAELAKKGQRLSIDWFKDQLNRSLCNWGLDLDLLRPDKKNVTEHKFRSPIGWFVSGNYAHMGRHYSGQCMSVFDDMYRLVPESASRNRYYHHQYHSVSASFAYTMDDAIASKGLEEDSEDESNTIEEIQEDTVNNKPVGWKHIGHVDDLRNVADDSGVCLMDEDKSKAEASTSASTALVSTLSKSSVKPKKTSRRSVGSRLGLYPAIIMKFNRTYCRNGLNCSRYCCDQHGKELSLVLQDMLPADSPAMRDVLLSHALINGNNELVGQLMKGTYTPLVDKKVVNKKRFKLSSSQVSSNSSSSSTAVDPSKPILPTLAHLRILQAVERRPALEFLQRVLQGAPFKRGYVKSSKMSMREKEEDLDERYEWYAKTGHKDDRPVTKLFEEKDRLEEIDIITKKKTRSKNAKAAAAKRKSKKLKEKEDDDVEFSVVNDNTHLTNRGHLSRKTRKPVRYDEPSSTSSDVEEVVEQEGGSSSRVVEVDDVLDDGLDLTDLGSDDVEIEELTGSPKDRSRMDESDTDEEEEIDDNVEKLGLLEKDVPMYKFDVDITSYEMNLGELIRRSKSLALWNQHLQLLSWFEKRKDAMIKEKLSKARKNMETTERAIKNNFYKWLLEAIKKVGALEEKMKEVMEPAIKARLKSMKRKKQAAKLKALKKGTEKGNEKGNEKGTEKGTEKPKKGAVRKKSTSMRGWAYVPDSEMELLQPGKRKRASSTSTKKDVEVIVLDTDDEEEASGSSKAAGPSRKKQRVQRS